jgi:hypothetical protein
MTGTDVMAPMSRIANQGSVSSFPSTIVMKRIA